MTAFVAIPSSVGLTSTCGVRDSRSPLKAGLASHRLPSPRDTCRISSPASSSMSQTRSGWQFTTASVSPYGYWMNSSRRMIGARPAAFHARIAAWMSGSPGPTSSPVAGAGAGAGSPAGSTRGTARARSAGAAPVWPSGTQPVRTRDDPPRATRLRTRWRRSRDPMRRSSELLRPAQIGHVEPERVDENGLLRRGGNDLGRHDSLPLALAERQAVEAALLLRPAELPGRRGEPEQARHRRHHDVSLRGLEGIVRAVVLVEVDSGRAPGVRVDLLEPLFHRDPIGH